MPPIAFRAGTDLDIQPTQTPKLNFDFPDYLSLYFAGPAGDTVSFFGDLFLLGSTNSLFIDRAYGQFRLVPEKPGNNLLVLKVGRIDMRAEPFSSTYRKVTAQSYNVSTFRPISDVSALGDHDAGFEVWGAATGPDNRGGVAYAAGMVQGTEGKPATNNAKDYYWNISYKFGGMGVVGSRQQADSPPSSEGYSEKSIEIGTFGYRGQDVTKLTGQPLQDLITRNGLKFDAYYKHLNLYGAVVTGQDTVENTVPQLVQSSAFFTEADYMLLPWVMPVIRFEKTNYSNARNVDLLLPSLNFAIRANIRLGIESRFFNRLSSTGYARTGTNLSLVRLDFAF